MGDVIPLSSEAIQWLQRLARARDAGDGWDEADAGYAEWEELLALGVIEYRSAAFRLSDIGWWTLGRVVSRGDE